MGGALPAFTTAHTSQNRESLLVTPGQVLLFPDCISASAACPAGQTPLCCASCKAPLHFTGSCCQPQIHPLQPHTFHEVQICFSHARALSYPWFPFSDLLWIEKSHWPRFSRETRNILWKLPLLFPRIILSAPLSFSLPCPTVSETSPFPPGTAYSPTTCGRDPQLQGALSFRAALLSTQVHSDR